MQSGLTDSQFALDYMELIGSDYFCLFVKIVCGFPAPFDYHDLSHGYEGGYVFIVGF